MTVTAAPPDRSARATSGLQHRLFALACVIAVGFHVGEGAKWLGDVAHSGTRWADWIDLVVPYVVIAVAASVLLACAADRRAWLLFGTGAVAYAQGHGIHLAANSIDNAQGGHVAHLWDEIVGHWILYLGISLLVTALVRAMPPIPLSFGGVFAAAAVGFTWFDNAIEGGVPVLGFVAAVGVGGLAWRRGQLPIAAAYLVSVGLLVTWGIWQGGFPQFSQLGWI